jgi:uncharacterized membrane protein YgaE (UPF0421/DUF939 family)
MSKKLLFAIYLIECIVGVAIGFYLFHQSPEVGSWVLISTIMVLAPDREEANKFAFNRIKANLVGAGVGLILALIHPMNVIMMALGVVLAATFCEILNLKTARRSATVGVILISLAPAGNHFYEVAGERAIGVVSGCTLAMLLTLIMHSMVKFILRPNQRKEVHPIF